MTNNEKITSVVRKSPNYPALSLPLSIIGTENRTNGDRGKDCPRNQQVSDALIRGDGGDEFLESIFHPNSQALP